MEQFDQQVFKHTQALSSLKGMSIISVSNGEEIGTVEDVLVDPGQMTVEALVLIKGGLFRQDVYIIPTRQVQTWGKDVILVQSPDSMHKRASKGEFDHARPAGSILRGMDVISVGGERLGSLGDMLLDAQGRLVGIEVTRVGERLAKMQSRRERGRSVRLPVSMIHSMGKDVLVLNLSQVEAQAEASVVPEESAAAERPVDERVSSVPGTLSAVPVTGAEEDEVETVETVEPVEPEARAEDHPLEEEPKSS